MRFAWQPSVASRPASQSAIQPASLPASQPAGSRRVAAGGGGWERAQGRRGAEPASQQALHRRPELCTHLTTGLTPPSRASKGSSPCLPSSCSVATQPACAAALARASRLRGGPLLVWSPSLSAASEAGREAPPVAWVEDMTRAACAGCLQAGRQRRSGGGGGGRRGTPWTQRPGAACALPPASQPAKGLWHLLDQTAVSCTRSRAATRGDRACCSATRLTAMLRRLLMLL